MFRNLLGIELSQLRFALICSYVGGILLMATGLIFALPSVLSQDRLDREVAGRGALCQVENVRVGLADTSTLI